MPKEEFDYYKALKDQNYSTLLDNQIQLDNARQRALKNTNAGLAAAGFDSSGYGQLARQGVESQYLQGLQNAQVNYQNQNLEVDKMKYDAMNDAYTGLYSDLVSADIQSEDALNKYLTDYGLMKDGVLDRDAFNERYGSDNFARFNAAIRNLNNQFADVRKAASAQNAESLKNMSFVLNGDYSGDKKHVKGQSGTLGEWFDKESDLLMAKASSGELETNSVVKVTNGRNDVIYLKWNGVGFEKTNESEYNGSNSKHTLAHYDKKNYWDEESTVYDKKYGLGDEISEREAESLLTMYTSKNGVPDIYKRKEIIEKASSEEGFNTKKYVYYYRDGKWYRRKKSD